MLKKMIFFCKNRFFFFAHLSDKNAARNFQNKLYLLILKRKQNARHKRISQRKLFFVQRCFEKCFRRGQVPIKDTTFYYKPIFLKI